MASNAELVERLMQRMKGVPNFTEEDAQALVDDALQVHGFAPSDDVPAEEQSLVLLYALSESAWQVAMSVAHYFRYRDQEEEVDKSMVADNYRRLARDLRDDYEREKSKISGSSFKIMPRIDRPITMPPRKHRWWRQ